MSLEGSHILCACKFKGITRSVEYLGYGYAEAEELGKFSYSGSVLRHNRKCGTPEYIDAKSGSCVNCSPRSSETAEVSDCRSPESYCCTARRSSVRLHSAVNST